MQHRRRAPGVDLPQIASFRQIHRVTVAQALRGRRVTLPRAFSLRRFHAAQGRDVGTVSRLARTCRSSGAGSVGPLRGAFEERSVFPHGLFPSGFGLPLTSSWSFSLRTTSTWRLLARAQKRFHRLSGGPARLPLHLRPLPDCLHASAGEFCGPPVPPR